MGEEERISWRESNAKVQNNKEKNSKKGRRRIRRRVKKKRVINKLLASYNKKLAKLIANRIH